MRKSLAAFSVLSAIAGLASAQSNVTIYGTIDGGIRHQTNTNAAGDRLFSQTSGNYFSNRLGFKGAEDLGNGLKALFTLESGFNIDTGAQDVAGSIFNRTAAVGLGTKYGTLMAGRNYTVAYWTVVGYDPFSYRYPALAPLISGAGTSQPAAAVAAGLGAAATAGLRFNNDIQYTGTFGGLTARAEYSAGESAGSTRTGSARAAGLTYKHGGFSIGGAYTAKYNALAMRNTARTMGGSWSNEALRVSVGYADETQDAAAREFSNRLTWTGASYRLSPVWTATAAYYRTEATSTGLEGERDLVILGATYALSKRTLIYGGLDSNRYKGSLIPASRQTSQFGATTGIQTSF